MSSSLNTQVDGVVSRSFGRSANQMRPISFIRNYTCYAEGSVLACFGETKVLCNASVLKQLPSHVKSGGWLTAEYSMLPRSTHQRSEREAARGKQNGRTQEIQRLIGRSLRAAIDLTQIGEHTIHLDCDVIQADGGTRTAAISGAMLALSDALSWMQRELNLGHQALKDPVVAVSVGMLNGLLLLDLDYAEDSKCDADINLVFTHSKKLIEIQGTAERQFFDQQTLNRLIELAFLGGESIIGAQKIIKN